APHRRGRETPARPRTRRHRNATDPPRGGPGTPWRDHPSASGAVALARSRGRALELATPPPIRARPAGQPEYKPRARPTPKRGAGTGAWNRAPTRTSP